MPILLDRDLHRRLFFTCCFQAELGVPQSSDRPVRQYSSKRKKKIHVASLRPPCITFERSPRRCQPQQIAGHTHPYRRASIPRGNPRHPPGLKIRGRLSLHRAQTRYRSSPHLTIRVTLRPTSLDHLKSRLGRRPMEQRRSPSKQSRNHLICVYRSRPLWELFRFSSRTMM